MDSTKAILDTASRGPVLTTIAFLMAGIMTQFVWKENQQRRFYRTLPGPPHSGLWGHLAVVSEIEASLPPNCHPMAHYTEIARRYNLEGIFYLDLWPVIGGSVVLSDPKLTEQVTVTKPLPVHSLANKMFVPVVGEGMIAVVNGSVWKRLHSAMSPAFAMTHVRRLTGLMVHECQIFRLNLDKHVASGEAFSLEDVIARLVFDIISRIVIAMPLNAQTSDAKELNDFRELVALAEGRLDNIPSRKKPYSILDLMIRENVQEHIDAKKTGKPGLSQADEQLLLSNINGLLLGAHGTSTDTLAYTYMLLSKAPEVLDKMRQEHIAEFGSKFDTAMNLAIERPELLQNLPCTEAVLKEAMRMFPIGYIIRQGLPGMTISHNGRSLPLDNDLIVAVQGHAAHYNPKCFPEPDRFRPERWLEGKEIPPSYFISFGRGPRSCTGRNLALNEMKLVILSTIGDYEFECAGLKPNTKRRTRYTSLDTVFRDIIFQELGMEAKPRGGMMMTARRRA